MRGAIGSHEWCEAGATLDWREKVTMVVNLARLQVQEFVDASGLRSATLARQHARCDLDAIVVPDTRVAREALAHATDLCVPSVLQHCLRTYFFGRLLAQAHEKPVDDELLFVASVLHDLGISPSFISGACSLCFATIGARQAAGFVSARGWDARRTRQTYEAVSLHFNSIIDDTVHGTEARFVGEGASLDVLGVRAHRVPTSLVQAVLKRHPRLDFDAEILRANAAANHPPASRPGFLGGRAFDRMVANNPLRLLELTT